MPYEEAISVRTLYKTSLENLKAIFFFHILYISHQRQLSILHCRSCYYYVIYIRIGCTATKKNPQTFRYFMYLWFADSFFIIYIFFDSIEINYSQRGPHSQQQAFHLHLRRSQSMRYCHYDQRYALIQKAYQRIINQLLAHSHLWQDV